MVAVFQYIFILLKVITLCENPRGAECVLTVLIHMEYTLVKCGWLCMMTRAAVFVSSCSSRARWRRVARGDSQGEPLPFTLPFHFSLLPHFLSLSSLLPSSLLPLSSLPFSHFPSPTFPSLSPSCGYFFPQAHVVCVVYDLTDEDALDRVSQTLSHVTSVMWSCHNLPTHTVWQCSVTRVTTILKCMNWLNSACQLVHIVSNRTNLAVSHIVTYIVLSHVTYTWPCLTYMTSRPEDYF